MAKFRELHRLRRGRKLFTRDSRPEPNPVGEHVARFYPLGRRHPATDPASGPVAGWFLGSQIEMNRLVYFLLAERNQTYHVHVYRTVQFQ